jgi:hypothetical protein
MNPLIDKLKLEGNLSVERLKRIFRVMAKETHPDLASGASSFVRLRAFYEEALAFLRSRAAETHQAALTPGEARWALWDALVRYARLFYAPACDDLALDLIDLASCYDQNARDLFVRYYEFVFPRYPNFTNDIELQRLHRIVMTCLLHTARFFQTGEKRKMTIVGNYRQAFDLGKRKRENKHFVIVKEMYEWVLAEAETGRP